MNRKTLLILAATLYQMPAIRKARELGCRVLTLDNQPSNPGHALADVSYNISTMDSEAVLRVAQENKIDGVLAVCTDVALPTAAFVAEKMRLPGPSPYATRILCSKSAFRQWQREQGLSSPEAYGVLRDLIVPDGFFNTGWGVIKPNQSSGSKGVFIVRSEAEFRQRFSESLAFSPDGAVVLERFLEGTQCTCDGVLMNGRIAFSCLTDRITASAPHVTTHGHCFPSRLSPQAQQKTLDAIADVFARLDVRDTLFDCDLVLAEDGTPYILEMTPRLGGNSLASLMLVACGFDAMEYAVRLALGDSPRLPENPVFTPTAVVLLGAGETGRLQYNLDAVTELRREPWVATLELEKQPGEQVQSFINGAHRVGELLITGKTRDEVDARIAQALRRLDLTTF